MVLFDYDLEKMLYVIPPEQHDHESVSRILEAHPEVRFVSLVGIDIGGHDTDEKIPTAVFLEDFEKLMRDGVQTDGSSVVLPKIAGLSNAKVDIIPDAAVNWYVDHNYKNTDGETGLPVGTLRIPSFLRHNDIAQVGARVTLNKSIEAFSLELKSLLEEYPYVFDNLQIDSVDEIEEFVQGGALAEGHVVDLVAGLVLSEAGEEVGLHDVVDVAEVAAGLAVAVDVDGLATDEAGEPLGYDGRIGAEGILALAEDVEVAQAHGGEAVAAGKHVGIEFVDVLGHRVGREGMAYLVLDLGQLRGVAVGGGGGRVDEALHAGVAGGDDHVEEAVDVAAVGEEGIVDGARN